LDRQGEGANLRTLRIVHARRIHESPPIQTDLPNKNQYWMLRHGLATIDLPFVPPRSI
jgi:hypothetical protein